MNQRLLALIEEVKLARPDLAYPFVVKEAQAIIDFEDYDDTAEWAGEEGAPFASEPVTVETMH